MEHPHNNAKILWLWLLFFFNLEKRSKNGTSSVTPVNSSTDRKFTGHNVGYQCRQRADREFTGCRSHFHRHQTGEYQLQPLQYCFQRQSLLMLKTWRDLENGCPYDTVQQYQQLKVDVFLLISFNASNIRYTSDKVSKVYCNLNDESCLIWSWKKTHHTIFCLKCVNFKLT